MNLNDQENNKRSWYRGNFLTHVLLYNNQAMWLCGVGGKGERKKNLDPKDPEVVKLVFSFFWYNCPLFSKCWPGLARAEDTQPCGPDIWPACCEDPHRLLYLRYSEKRLTPRGMWPFMRTLSEWKICNLSWSAFKRWLKDLANIWFDYWSSGNWYHPRKCTPIFRRVLLRNVKGQCDTTLQLHVAVCNIIKIDTGKP